jgi:hypothetical protein
MNKQEAYQAMCQGHKVCNEYYTPDEYAFINPSTGLIEYEDGCVVGNQFSENWRVYQDPENKFEWHIWKSDADLLMEANPEFIGELEDRGISNMQQESYLIHNTHKMDYYSPKFFVTKEFIPKNSHKRSNKR